MHWRETWTTGTGDNRRRETISYTSNETYVQQKTVLWNSEQTPHGKIGPGSYSFQFQFIIPPQCPSSFRGSVGYIRYHLLGRIGTGLFRFDHRIEAPIQVSQLIDINQPQFQVPVRQTQRKQVGCLEEEREGGKRRRGEKVSSYSGLLTPVFVTWVRRPGYWARGKEVSRCSNVSPLGVCSYHN